MSEKPGGKKARARKAPRSEEGPRERADGQESGRSFEEAFAQAERAVDLLERGDLTLEDSLRTYEEGVRGLQRCYDVLGRFESRIEVLASELGRVAEGDDGPIWVPAGTVPGLRGAEEAARREAELPDEPDADESADVHIEADIEAEDEDE